MAAAFLSSASTLSSPFLYSSPSASSSTTTETVSYSNVRRPQSHHTILCKAVSDSSSSSSPILTKRSLAICLTTSLTLSLASEVFQNANAAILEADDDVELLEKVKKDRKKRLERQLVINSSKKETGYVQEIVYRLSKVGQAIDNNDLTTASSVLGPSTDADWIKQVNTAFTKLTDGIEEKTEVDTFNSSISSLISSVTKNDINSSKLAFVSSASALEKWSALTGVADLLKGL